MTRLSNDSFDFVSVWMLCSMGYCVVLLTLKKRDLVFMDQMYCFLKESVAKESSRIMLRVIFDEMTDIIIYNRFQRQ